MQSRLEANCETDCIMLIDRPVDPVLSKYGHWRFLTYNNLVVQFLTYLALLLSHYVPAAVKWRNYLFTVLALPVGMFVVITFWSVWFIAGRENILPVEANCPDWLNHICHTIILPINFIQLAVMKHNYLPDKEALISLSGFLMLYNVYILYIRWQTGKFVYVFMNKMSGVLVGVFIVGMLIMALAFYKLGKFIHDYRHKNNIEPAQREIVVRADYKVSSRSARDNSNGLTLSIE